MPESDADQLKQCARVRHFGSAAPEYSFLGIGRKLHHFAAGAMETRIFPARLLAMKPESSHLMEGLVPTHYR